MAQSKEALKIFAVAGDPISHSLSPQMMNAALNSQEINGKYVTLAAESAKDIVETMAFLDIAGCNITAPFKISALHCLDDYDIRVEQAVCTNLILQKEGHFTGYNTDVNGIYLALTTIFEDYRSKSVLILGYGGAARAAAYTCSLMQMQRYVSGKDLQKIERFAELTGCIPVAQEDIQKYVDQVDVIISTVPKETILLNQVTFSEQQTVLDCSYSNLNLQNKVTSRNAFYISGKDWLLYQGCPSYKLFTGEDAPVEEMKKALQHEVSYPKTCSIIAVSEGWLQTVEAHLSNFFVSTFNLMEDPCSLRKLKKRIRKSGEDSLSVVIATTSFLEDQKFRDFIHDETFTIFLVNANEKEKDMARKYIGVADILLPIKDKTGSQIASRIKKEIENIM